MSEAVSILQVILASVSFDAHDPGTGTQHQKLLFSFLSLLKPASYWPFGWMHWSWHNIIVAWILAKLRYLLQHFVCCLALWVLNWSFLYYCAVFSKAFAREQAIWLLFCFVFFSSEFNFFCFWGMALFEVCICLWIFYFISSLYWICSNIVQ